MALEPLDKGREYEEGSFSREDVLLRNEDFYQRDPYFTRVSYIYHILQWILWGVLTVFIILSMLLRSQDITYENLFYLFKDIDAAVDSQDVSFTSLVYDADDRQSFSAYRGGLAVAGSKGLTVFTATGRQTLKMSQSYLTPRVLASDKYLLTYGQGENGFSVCNSFARLRTYGTEGPVYCGAVSDNGWFAVSCQGKQYPSVVSVYDASLRQKTRFWKNSFVTALTFDPSGRYLIVCCVKAVGGHYVTELEWYQAGEKDMTQSFVVQDFFPLKVAFMGKNALLVCSGHEWLILDGVGTVVARGDLSEPDRFFVSDNGFAVLTGELLEIFDREGNGIGSRLASADTRQVLVGEKTLYMLIGNTVYSYRFSDGAGEATEFDFPVSDLLWYDEDRLLVCSRSKARYFGKR